MFPTLAEPNKRTAPAFVAFPVYRGVSRGIISRGIITVVAIGLAAIAGLVQSSTVMAEAKPVVTPATVIEQTGPAGLKTYRWDFSRVSDQDFNRWPDDFTRHKATGYPEYVGIEIQPRDRVIEKNIVQLDTSMALGWRTLREWLKRFPAVPEFAPLPPSIADYVVDRCLEIQLNGGQARVLTTRLPTSSTYQYRFSVDIHTKGLVHDQVFAEVLFSDAEGNELRSIKTPSVTKTNGWQTIVIEKLVPPHGATGMRVAMNVVSGEGGLEDIYASVSFDNIVFRQFPQMKIATDHRFGVYRNGESVTTTTRLLGLPSETADIRLRLLDHDGKELRTTLERMVNGHLLKKNTVLEGPPNSDTNTDGQTNSKPDNALEILWTLDDLQPGFYRVTAALENQFGASLANQTSLVVIDRLTNDTREWSPEMDSANRETRGNPSDSPYGDSIGSLDPVPFGWTLSKNLMQQHRDGGLPDKLVARWLRDVGVGWVKMPVWFERDDTSAADAAGSLAFRMSDHGVQPVGMLDEPPESSVEHYRLRDRGETGAAAYFHSPELWKSQLDTIMNRMTFRIRKWQLGRDDDYSFQSRSDLATRINEIASELQGFGQPLEVAISWPWMDVPPQVSGESWRAVNRSIDRPLAADELDAILDLEKETSQDSVRSLSGTKTWMTINPLSRQQYHRDARITDLILRMATVRGHQVEAAFVTKPMATDSAMVTADGHPDELLLPWRTASMLLGRSRNIGSLRLRMRSNNLVFRGDQISVLLVWANSPQTERLFLGDHVYEVDVWGRRSPILTEQVDGRTVHRIEVGTLPKFIVGIDPALAEFRMSVAVDRKRIDALLGRDQPISVRYANPVAQPLDGEISLVTPSQWRVSPDSQTWELNPREASQSEFSVVLGNNATIGNYELPIDFRFTTTPPTVIRVYREMDVGPEGFELIVNTRLVGDRLQVKIQMTNNTGLGANFDCLLFAGADRQYERRILVLAPGETAERNVDWPRGAELIGSRLLLRAIEQDGDRVINHAFDVVP